MQTLAKTQVTVIFLKQDMRRNVLSKYIEISMETSRSAFWGGSRIFIKEGVHHYFNTNKPHSFFFFCRIPVVLESHRSSQGGAHPCIPLNLPMGMLEPIQMGSNMAVGNQQKHLSLSFAIKALIIS